MLTQKRWTPAQQIEQNRTQTVHIRRQSNLPQRSVHLLRCNVAGRAENGECGCEVTRAIEPLGQTKIAHQRFAPPIQQNISRFQIAMQNALLMRVLHRSRNLGHQSHCAPWLMAQSRSCIQQTAATSKLHAEERQPILALAHFVNWQNVRMIEARCGLRLAPETRQRPL